jgi:hypothetical protein
MKLVDIITELFSPEYVYPVTATDDETYKSPLTGQRQRTIRYEFTTKDNVTYRAMVHIWKKDKTARIDFDTQSKNPKHRSIIGLINTYDALKVFNTLKSILEKHRAEFNKVIISTHPIRMPFYEKLLQYFHINYKKIGNSEILATL